MEVIRIREKPGLGTGTVMGVGGRGIRVRVEGKRQEGDEGAV